MVPSQGVQSARVQTEVAGWKESVPTVATCSLG